LGEPNLIVADIVEGTREPLFDAANARYRSFYWNFKWSPDGRKIAFKGLRTDGQIEIAIVDARGAKHGLVTRFVGQVNNAIAYRPDGRRLLIGYRTAGPGTPIQLCELDPDTDDPPERLPGQ